MKTQPRHKIYGTPLDKWVEQVPAELDQDAVGLFQPIVAGTDGFELNGSELDDFVRRCIKALLLAGGVPTIPRNHQWLPEPGYAGTPDEVARKIVDQWHSGEVLADHDGLWFVKL